MTEHERAPSEKRTGREQQLRERDTAVREEGPERTRRPAPGIVHEPEPDAENIVPAEDRPGTL
ncbi:MAG TPA: hypothetical protein VFZ69_14905 [Longimicrobiales bacterium]